MKKYQVAIVGPGGWEWDLDEYGQRVWYGDKQHAEKRAAYLNSTKTAVAVAENDDGTFTLPDGETTT